MRVGVIRNDLSAPILLADLVVQGQDVYLSYTTNAQIEAVLADPVTGAGATIRGSALTFPVTLVSPTSNALKLKTASADAYTTYTIAAGAYANMTTLLAAINAALATSDIRAFDSGSARVALESQNFGVASYLQNDNEAGGSNANSELGLTNGSTRNMPAASAFAAAIGLPGGLNISSTALGAVGAGNNTNALDPHYDAGLTRGGAALADLVAPRFAETGSAVESFLVGNLAGFKSSAFNPDPRNSASVVGAAVIVREDDGSTAFAATLPTLTTADLNTPTAGDLTLTGTGLGKESGEAKDRLRSTTVKLTGAVTLVLHQEAIEAAGGTVSDTSIYIPAALVPGAVVTTTSARVQHRQRVSAAVALT